jgi:hypothetical protein
MNTLILVVFLVGYVFIALEHSTNINKTAIAIVTGVLCWTLFMVSTPNESLLQSSDFQKFLDVSKIEVGAARLSSFTAAELHHEFVTFSLDEHLGQIARFFSFF